MPRPNPFPMTLDARFLYLTDSLRETIAKARYVVDNRLGLMALYGEVGHGKSSVLRYIYGELAGREDVEAALITDPNYDTGLALLRAIGVEFGLPRRRSKFDQTLETQKYLAGLLQSGKNAVVLVDEAQEMKGRVLELVRSLLNFETAETKLITVIICGQLELRDKLRDESKRALRSRIFTSSTLSPLTLEQTTAMIAFRCAQVGEPNRFTPEALEFVYQATRGVPREVVKVAGAAWGAVAIAGEDVVGLEAVEYVAPDAEVHGYQAAEASV